MSPRSLARYRTEVTNKNGRMARATLFSSDSSKPTFYVRRANHHSHSPSELESLRSCRRSLAAALVMLQDASLELKLYRHPAVTLGQHSGLANA